MAPFVEMARCVCRDPAASPAIERIDGMLVSAQQLIAAPVAGEALAAMGLVHAAAVIAATEPVAA
jgi:hypothetical protein